MISHGSASLQLFPVVRIFLRSLSVKCYDRGSQKLLQRFMSHKLTAKLSILNLFKLNELWPYYPKHVNQIILNRTTLWSLALQIFETFIWILLIGNLSLDQTLLTFLLCETDLDDSFDSGKFSVRLSFFNPNGFWYSCMVLQFMLEKDFLLHGTHL